MQEQGLDLCLELGGPQVGVLELELVDQVDAEVAVHRLVAQDVLVLLGRAGHLVLATQRQDLREADVEEQAFHQAGEHDQRLQQGLIGSRACRCGSWGSMIASMKGIRNSSLSRMDWTSL